MSQKPKTPLHRVGRTPIYAYKLLILFVTPINELHHDKKDYSKTFNWLDGLPWV